MAISYGTITITDLGSVTKVDVYYYVSTSATELEGGSWSTDAPVWSDNKYIWSKTVTTWEEGRTTESNPACITGAKGTTGQSGRSVQSIKEQYYLSTSSTSQAGGSWQDAMPTYVNGRYYWTHSIITWKEPNGSTTTETTTAVLANALTSANSTAKSASDTATTANNTANAANTTAGEAKSIAQEAQSTAGQALTTANNKNKTFYQDSQPTGGSYLDGDSWYDTNDDNKLYIYNGTSKKWVAQQFGNAAIADSSITNAKIANATIQSAKIISLEGAKIVANSITANQLATDAIKSNNYQASPNTSSPYSATGTFLDLSTGNIYTPNFGVDSVNGAAHINGQIIATSGQIGDSSTNYWQIGTYNDYNMNPSAAIIGNGTSYIQSGTWQISNNRINTQTYDGNNQITYIHYGSKYWDYGMQVPELDSTKSTYIDGVSNNWLYIRRTKTNSIPSLETDWDYLFRVDKDGTVYENGVKLSEKYASIDGVSGAYLPRSGGTITGNLTVNGTLTATASKANALTHTLSINGQSWSGSADLTINTLGVVYGGTGAKTFTSGYALIGNGTNAIQTRAIKNNTTNGALGWVSSSASTELVTTNTIAYWNGAYTGTSSNLLYTKWGAMTDIVTKDYEDFITVNGGIIDGSLQVTDLTVGDLIVNGAGRFTNGLYGELTGNASTATKVNYDLIIKLASGTTEGTNMFSFNGSTAKTIDITKSSIGLGNVENTKLSTWVGSSNLTTTKVGTLAEAAVKAVDTSISASSTSVNLPTSAAVANFVEGKGYVTSSGVTSVRVQATNPIVSSVNTAQSSTLNTIISLADGYGDTKNPYASKTKNYILAAPSGQNGVPTFRALVADDIPTLASSKVGLGNVTNNKQVKGLSSGTISGHLVSWGTDGYTVTDSGVTSGNVTTKLTLAGTDYSASSNVITVTQTNLQNAVQSTGLVLMTSAERTKLASIQVSEGGTIDFSGVTASAPLTATVAADKTVNITHNTSGVTAGTYRSVTVNTYGHVTAGTNPTTLSGYGITDAKIANGIITLGNNTITPLTASSTLDATKISGTASVSTTGNAGTATKFSSVRKIELTGDVTGSASSDGTSGWSIVTTVENNSHSHVPSNIIARNDNTSGGLDPITASKIGSAASNKTFGLPANAITIEYSTDGGATWVDYGATDAQKRDLFNETRSTSFFLGKSAEKSVNNQLRVTIEPTDRYTSFHGLYCWMSTSGNTCTVDLERSTIGNKNTFSTVFTGKPISGWSGNNIIYFNYGTFGGGSTQTGNQYKYRMVFKQTAITTSNTVNSSIQDIRFIGDNVWSSPNVMVSKNHMYSWDRDFNVTFPAQITANQFNGNATSATSATSANSATKATQDSDGHQINTTYLKLEGGTMTGVLTVKKDQYTDSYSGALNMNNSNIYGVNSIYTADASDNSQEGIHFYRSATTVDSLHAKAGVLYFTPNRTLGQVGTSYTIYHTGNKPTKSDVGLGNVDNTADANKTVKGVNAVAGSTDAYRHVWFSDSSTETVRNYDDDFKYNPSKNDLKIASVTGTTLQLTNWKIEEDSSTNALMFRFVG